MTKVRKRRQKWIAFHGTEKQAHLKLNDLVGKAQRNEFVEPTRLTLAEWLDAWLEKAIKPPRKTERTYAGYLSHIKSAIKPKLGSIRLQALTAADIERYFVDQRALAVATLQVHQAILSGALQSAVRNHLVYHNAAKNVEGKPRAKRTADAIIANCWTLDETRTFLATIKQERLQVRTFFTLALDSGCRKSELLGVKWSDLDVEAGTLQINRQILDHSVRKRGSAPVQTEPTFVVPKTGRSRVIELGTETLQLLRDHKKHQAEVKMRNRSSYRDYGLIFAREVEDTYGRDSALGLPLRPSTIADKMFHDLTTAAKVHRITFHGVRHTSASLLLQSGEMPKVIQERLGHASIGITMNTYAHLQPGMQKQAASRLNNLLHG